MRVTQHLRKGLEGSFRHSKKHIEGFLREPSDTNSAAKMGEDIADEADGLDGLRCSRVGEKATRIFCALSLSRARALSLLALSLALSLSFSQLSLEHTVGFVFIENATFEGLIVFEPMLYVWV